MSTKLSVADIDRLEARLATIRLEIRDNERRRQHAVADLPASDRAVGAARRSEAKRELRILCDERDGLAAALKHLREVRRRLDSADEKARLENKLKRVRELHAKLDKSDQRLVKLRNSIEKELRTRYEIEAGISEIYPGWDIGAARSGVMAFLTEAGYGYTGRSNYLYPEHAPKKPDGRLNLRAVEDEMKRRHERFLLAKVRHAHRTSDGAVAGPATKYLSLRLARGDGEETHHPA